MRKKLIIVLPLLILLVFCLHYFFFQTDDSPSSCADERGLAFYNIKDYNQFVDSETNLPDGFVTMDRLDFLGTFYGFICYSDYWKDDYSDYLYELKDINGNFVSLRITHGNNNNLTARQQIVSIPQGTTDLRKIPNADYNRTAEYNRNELCYIYGKTGGLSCIEWRENGIRYRLSGDGSLVHYPFYGDKTIIHRMLSIAEVESEAAFTELKEAINKKS